MNFKLLKIKINNKLKNNETKNLVSNFLSLTILNIVNYIFPIILIPYLTITLGVEKYGTYIFAYTLINYFVLLVRYGFDFSATKQVAILRNNVIKLNIILSSVIIIRLILSILLILILLIIITYIPKLNQDFLLYIYGTGIILGIALTPTWFFQGMEKMKYITLTNVLSKAILFVLIILFVKSEVDYSKVLLFHSISYLISALCGIILLQKSFNVKFIIPSYRDILYQLNDGWQLFLSTIGINFYRESNILILGFITNFNVVGQYAAAEKIIKAIQSITVPIVNTLFPFFGRKLNQFNNYSSIKLYDKIGKYYLVLLIILTILAFFSSKIIINLLGEDYSESILNFQILSLLITIGGYNYYIGMLGLVNMGKQKQFTISVWISGIFGIVLCLILSSMFKDIGASISVVLVELLLLGLLYFFYSKNKKLKTLHLV